MDIVEFLQLSSGKWFSQRTSHHVSFKQSETGKSDLQIDLLEKTDSDVAQLCQHCKIDPDLALCGSRISWNGAMEWNKDKQAGSTLLVPIAHADKPNEGQLLRAIGSTKMPPVIGRYIMGSDDALTLIMEDDTMKSEERLWFVSPNLRLRTTVLKRSDGLSQAAFCSEIRMGVTKPPAESV